MTDKTTPVSAIDHDASRANLPTPELEPVMHPAEKAPVRVAYERRNRDLDPQLVWRGKDPDQDALEVQAPPIYLQEQVHPKAIIEDLRAGRPRNGEGGGVDLFDHFGVTDDDREAEVEFYRHSKKWSNRMILGDSLAVMASLAEREGLRGQVQAIYIDPPYGIKFNSNFQWSTTSRHVKDGNLSHLTREPEQVKAFRDTWRDGIHSYLAYLRDRLVAARDLLTESGSCFVQIGDENVHRVRALMDEVFGEENFCALITLAKTGGQETSGLPNVTDYIVWFAKNRSTMKYRQQWLPKEHGVGKGSGARYDRAEYGEGERASLAELEKSLGSVPDDIRPYQLTSLISSGIRSNTTTGWHFNGAPFHSGATSNWKTSLIGLSRLALASRIEARKRTIAYVRFIDDFPAYAVSNMWTDVAGAAGLVYVVQTSATIIQRCLLMTTDPGDLVLDPTCGSGTTAHVAEQWGRRWITIDTSRVALALARARIMGAKYPYYLLADSEEGRRKTAEITREAPSPLPTHNDVRHGFVYQRVPHITLKSIANNAEIDVIWDRLQPAAEAARAALNAALRGHPEPLPIETGGRKGEAVDFRRTGEVALPSGEPAPAGGLMEWEIPREAPPSWPAPARDALAAFWEARIERQREIDASIAAKAEFENLYDKPYEDRKRIRVAGPFTVESLSPHRTMAVDENGEIIDSVDAAAGERSRGAREAENYQAAMLENLKRAGVQQIDKGARLTFHELTGWPGEWLCAEARYLEGEGEDAQERRAGIFIGPEYGTVQRADLVACAREAADAGFDILIACAFNFDAHTAELRRLGRVPILQARMNPDLHMADELKAGGGNLFVVFGEPDVELVAEGDLLRVRLRGVEIFRPTTGEVVVSEPDEIACWFLDTDYDLESFFVRHAYFPGAQSPYEGLKRSLKAEVDEEAWESLTRTESRPFPRPKRGRIAVKVINHLGDEVMKVLEA
ncbi:MAG: site-specific DNA-methyltransferase [Pseudomonadota bacterium]|nr:site-specific DNA-methyltransferase [Pseudomonadota bacterium]MEE3101008.1 site-specific DNA-methyltransferase [Pseudomonadota bacterium]